MSTAVRVWKSIIGHEGKYSVSDDGKIRNDKTGRILKPWKDNNGYRCIRLGACTTNKHICRLLCIAFLGKRSDNWEPNHKNGIKGDDRLENLEWLTHAQNGKHAWDIGTHVATPLYGKANGNTILTIRKVLKIRNLYASGKYSHRALGEMFKVNASTIAQVVNCVTWTHILPRVLVS